jgi:hypothetical protein
MAIKRTITFTWGTDRTDMSTFQEWINALPDAEQSLVNAAIARQDALISTNVGNGKLTQTLDDSNNTAEFNFTDDETPYTSTDAEWKTFFERYLSETGQTVTIVDETI